MSTSAPDLRERITISGRLEIDGLDHLIGALDPLLRATSRTETVVDLSGVSYAKPSGIAVLRSALHRAVGDGILDGGSNLVEPRSSDVARYVRRMNAFEGIVTFGTPEAFRRHPPRGFAPAMTFPTEECSEEDAARGLMASFPTTLPPIVRQALHRSLVELSENVVLHAGPTLGIAGAQSWVTRNRGWIEMAIADRGVGIPDALRANPVYADLSDAEALTMALNLDVTGHTAGTPGYGVRRGYGLWEVSELVKANGGRLHVRSGSHALHMSAEGPVVTERDVHWPGTIVVLELDLQGSFVISEAWQAALPEGTALDDEITL
ncbi:MAG: hypothetical protein AB7I38_19505 [Dehalococcoidia bacterium]